MKCICSGLGIELRLGHKHLDQDTPNLHRIIKIKMIMSKVWVGCMGDFSQKHSLAYFKLIKLPNATY